MIDKLRTEAAQAAVDYLADVILYNTAKPKIDACQQSVKSATANIEQAQQAIATTSKNIADITEKIADLRGKLAKNNQPGKAPAIEADITRNMKRLGELQTTLTNYETKLATYQQNLADNQAAIVALRMVGKPKKPAGLYGLEL